jgi:DNA primase
MADPRPLYRLPNIASADRVFVTEGEKAADAVRSMGLVATTSPHGSNNAGKADWSPLAEKEVIVLPDNDELGIQYAEKAGECLTRLKPTPIVKVVILWKDWPDMPEKGDAAD